MATQDDHEMGEGPSTVPESDQVVTDTLMETSLSAVSGGSSAADESAMQHLNVSRFFERPGQHFEALWRFEVAEFFIFI